MNVFRIFFRIGCLSPIIVRRHFFLAATHVWTILEEMVIDRFKASAFKKWYTTFNVREFVFMCEFSLFKFKNVSFAIIGLILRWVISVCLFVACFKYSEMWHQLLVTLRLTFWIHRVSVMFVRKNCTDYDEKLMVLFHISLWKMSLRVHYKLGFGIWRNTKKSLCLQTPLRYISYNENWNRILMFD